MTDLYADSESVVETLRHLKENGPGGGELHVVHAGRARVVAETLDDLIERNLYDSFDAAVDDTICYIEWVRTPIGDRESMLMELVFHESVVDSELTLDTVGPRAIGATQATSPVDLGDGLREALEPLVDELGATFTFKGVEAASMAHGGHYTDFEYEYSIDCVDL